MTAYVVEYRPITDRARMLRTSRISSEGYTSLEAAQDYIESRSGSPVKCSEYYYQDKFLAEYYIHEVRIIERRNGK